MRRILNLALVVGWIAAAAWLLPQRCNAAPDLDQACQQPAAGSAVRQPEDIRSLNRVLKADLYFHRVTDAAGHARYCYLSVEGNQSPTLRVHPGDLLILNLHNEINGIDDGATSNIETGKKRRAITDMSARTASGIAACTHEVMNAFSTNLHFHGLTIAPVCHQDEVITTAVRPSQTFEYRLRIPADQPPGLYWYHPHLHGFSKTQVLGGASGALIVEGAEQIDREVAGLPERILAIRDQDLVNPTAQPTGDPFGAAPIIVDRDGDARNTGSGGGKPAKDLSVNFVPVPYPNYPPAVIQMRVGERELWRVLNASAISYLSLQVLSEGRAQQLGVTGMDGVPVDWNGSPVGVIWQNHLRAAGRPGRIYCARSR